MSGFTTVTGIIKDGAGNLYGGARIMASFVGQSTTAGAGPYLLNGIPSGIFATVLVEQADSLGNFSFLLADNNQIQPTPSQWSFSVVSFDGTKSFNLLVTITGATQNITTNIQAVAPPLTPVIGGTVSTNLIPLNATGLTLGNAGQRWDGFIRNLSGVSNIDNIILLDGTTFTTIAGALAALPASGGVVIVPPNYGEAVAADITVSHDSGLLFLGPAAVNMGTHQFKFAGGTANGFFISSVIPFGSNGSPSAGVIFTYTGTTTPFALGTAGAGSFGLLLENFAIDLTGANAAAVGIQLIRMHPYTLNNLRIIGISGQVGIVGNDGASGDYTGNGLINNLSTNGLTSGIKGNGNFNGNQIFAVIANTAAGGKGIDLSDGNGNVIVANIESATVGCSFGASANTFGNWVFMYGQNNGTDFVFGAGCLRNIVHNIGANGTTIITSVTDSSGNNTNSVLDPTNIQFQQGGAMRVGGLLSALNGLTLAAGKALTAGRAVTSGTVPTSATVTGAGAGGTVVIAANSTDSFGELTIQCSGAGPAATGTLTINFSAALGANRSIGLCIANNNNTVWNVRASFLQTSTGTASITFAWDNNGAALVAGNNYNVSYFVFGR